MIREAFGRLLKGRDGPLPYDEAKKAAREGDVEERLAVASDPHALPEMLYYLARDASTRVRAAVAAHHATPRQADMILAVDDSPGVRVLIAEKVSSQLHSVDYEEGAQLWQLTVSILEALARDDLKRVRQLVAEAARDLAKVPKPVALTLAKDHETDIAVTALGYAGRFADEEMIEVVHGAHDPRVIAAVAQRPGIGPAVADAIVEAGDERSIGVLLGNKTATIAAATLDKVVTRAVAVPAWHEALVQRPELSQASSKKLAGFVGRRLAARLNPETEIPPVFIAPSEAAETGELAAAEPILAVEEPVSKVRRLDAAGRLNEDEIVEALGVEPDFVVAALAYRARLPLPVVDKILRARGAKGLVALAWRSGYTMRLALQLQMRVGHVPPNARLSPVAGSWPLTTEEMSWQIEFFQTLVMQG